MATKRFEVTLEEELIRTEPVRFSLMICGNCNIPFYVPEIWKKRKVADKENFTCPNGCARKFVGETEADKLRKDIQDIVREKEQQEIFLTNKLLDEMVTRKEAEGKLNQLKNGVCPCCNRLFHNLQQHIKKQHPELIKK